MILPFTAKGKARMPAGHGLGDTERLARLRLSRTERVGPVTFYRLIETYGSAEKALAVLPTLARRGGGAKAPVIPPEGAAERELAQLQKLGGTLVVAGEEDYPLALSALEDAPPVLSAIGRRDLLGAESLGIVGARNASLNGRRFAETLARDVGRAGFVITSGLARGIDTAAHEGGLPTGTVAVVAGGIDVVYPPENQKLYDQIRETGLVLAESPLGQQPFAQSFPRRNRIVSGLSAGIVVVEATERSGSLITARLAGEQGRDVYAVPGHPLDPRAAGPNKLIREGAILVRGADDILEGLRNFSGGLLREALPQAPYIAAAPTDADTDDIRRDILAQLSFTPVDVNDLMREIGAAGIVQIALLELELAGEIQRLPGNRVVRL